jgi:hypothetical protein
VPDLDFQVEGVAPLLYAVAPTLVFKLRVTNATAEPIHSILLRCQLMLEVTRRHYSPQEQEKLLDLFGEPQQWDRTLHSMLWTTVNLTVPAFTGSTVVDLNAPCSFDFNVAATKYFAALTTGEAPLLLLFNGTVFYAAPHGALQVTQISWEKEASYRLPVGIWRAMMDVYYPDSVWLNLPRAVFDQLDQYKRRRGIPTFEQALEQLIPVWEAEDEPLYREPNGGETIH